jgi:ribosomal protein S27AE
MDDMQCRRCGNKAFIKGFISVRCPICGEYVFLDEVDDSLLWSEHKLGILLQRGGWRWLSEIEPPRWFLENVV